MCSVKQCYNGASYRKERVTKKIMRKRRYVCRVCWEKPMWERPCTVPTQGVQGAVAGMGAGGADEASRPVVNRQIMGRACWRTYGCDCFVSLCRREKSSLWALLRWL